MAHHAHTPGVIAKPQTRRIWVIFWILLAFTIIEVFIALPNIRHGYFPTDGLFKVTLILFTLAKATCIVAYYMHLGDEVRNLILTITLPFILIVGFIAVIYLEGTYISPLRTLIEQIVIQ